LIPPIRISSTGPITIRCTPRDLFPYSNLGIIQENIVNQVLDDGVKACNKVVGDFRPRSGISTIVEAFRPKLQRAQ
jgi:7-cyano-7-deazaguanine reductase